MSFVVAVKPDALAGRRVAVPPRVDEAHVRDSVVVGNRVLAFAIRAVRAVASAGGSLKTCTTEIYIQNECAHVGLSIHAPG